MGAIAEAKKSDDDWRTQRAERAAQLASWRPTDRQRGELLVRLGGDRRAYVDELAWFSRRYLTFGFGGLDPNAAFDRYLRTVPPAAMAQRGAA